MRVARAKPRGDALVLMARFARAARVAVLARRRIRAGVHRVASEKILTVDEPAIGAVDQLGLDRHHRRLRMAVEAEVLVVEGGGGLLVGGGRAWGAGRA